MELKDRVVSGVLWSAAEKFSSLAVHLCVAVILLSLLEPSDFGLMSMLTVFTVLSNSIIDSGFSQALIQKKNASAEDYDSIFWLNIAIAVALYALMWSLIGPITRFYDAPQLAAIAPWVFCSMPLSALGIIQTTILMKKMDFRAISKANFSASLISGITVVTLAWLGYGVWALVGQILSLYFVRTGVLWLQGNWHPRLRFSLASVKGLFGLGSRLFATGMITQLFNNLSLMIVGRIYDASQLGLFSQSLKLKNSVAEAIGLSVQNVTFPAFASLQDERDKLRIASRKVISVFSFLLFPVMLGLVAVADEGFMIAGQEKWLPAAPYFRVLCLSALCMPLMNISLNLMKALGRGQTILRIEIVKKGFGLIAMIGAATISVYAVAWAYLAWVLFETAVNSVFVRRLTGYKFHSQAADTLPYLVMASIMLLCVLGVGYLLRDSSVYTLLAIKAATGIAVYCLMAVILKPEGWREFRHIFRAILHR